MSEGANHTAGGGRVLYYVFAWVPEEIREEWNDWHTNVHIPNVLKAPQMRGAKKYRLRQATFPGDWQPQYVTIYELDSLADFQAFIAGPGVALRAVHDAMYGDVERIARVVVREADRIL